RIRGVQNPEAVLSWLNFEVGPHLAVDQHRVAEELGDPNGRNPRIWIAPIVLNGIEKGAVRAEEPILNDQRDLVSAIGKVEFVLDVVAEQVDAREAGIVVESRRAERMSWYHSCVAAWSLG